MASISQSQGWLSEIHDRVCQIISLRSFDERWRTTINGSLLLGSLLRLRLGTTEQLGSNLQRLSFVVLLCLLAILGLPMFASDKEGLAAIALGGLGLWLAGYALGGKETRRANTVDAIVLIYLAFNIVAACSSHYFRESIHGLLKVAVYIASYFWFTAVLGQSRTRQVYALSALLASGFAVALYGLYQYKIGVAPLATWEDPTVEEKSTRIYSTLGNPNLLAGYLLPMVPLALGLGLSALAARRRLLVLPAFLTAGVILIATVLTASRGGYIGLFFAVGALVFVLAQKVLAEHPKARMPVVAGLLASAIVALAALHFVPTFEHRVMSIFAGREHSSNSFRMNVYQSSFKMFKDNWWIGVGPGNQAFRLAYGLYMTSGFDALGTYCVPLEVAVEAGIGALLCFGALFASLMSRAHLAFWQNGNRWSIWLIAGSAAALLGMMMHGLVDTVFYRPQVQFIFWLLVAMMQTEPESRSEMQSP